MRRDAQAGVAQGIIDGVETVREARCVRRLSARFFLRAGFAFGARRGRGCLDEACEGEREVDAWARLWHRPFDARGLACAFGFERDLARHQDEEEPRELFKFRQEARNAFEERRRDTALDERRVEMFHQLVDHIGEAMVQRSDRVGG